MKYADVKALAKSILGEEYKGTIYPGPYEADIPGEHIIATGYGGPGEDTDGTMDNVSWQFRVIGKQNNYESAEDVAQRLDKGFLSWHSARMSEGGPWLAGIQRSGGAPAPLLRDDSDRTHFVCSYIFSVELALAN